MLNAQDFQHQVKLNLSSLPLGIVSMAYEHPIKNGKSSWQIGARWMPSRQLPLQNLTGTVLRGINLNDDIQVGKTAVGGFGLNAQIRWYLGKFKTKGLYVSPIIVHNNYALGVPIELNLDSSNTNLGILFTGRYKDLSGGVQVGYQFHVRQRISVDLLFAGLTVGGAKYSLRAQSPDLVLSAQELLEAELKLNEFGETLLNGAISQVTNNGVSFSAAGTTVGWRTGLAIGYRF
ncbi:MAG: hypothetical protein RL660_1051 [Bacteroidota bacterium]|jgi:hypothetical protein